MSHGNAQGGGCGGGACTCGGGQGASTATAEVPLIPPSINGIALVEPGEALPPEEELRERAWTELLRQEAVVRGLLPRVHVLEAPQLNEGEQAVIQRMLDEAVPAPEADETACRRFHEANRSRFMDGQRVQLRHILFAVTPGVDVERLAQRAEAVLLELANKDAPAGLFAQRAGELSNCPSGAAGGELGWLTPQDCAEELARDLFVASPPPPPGLRPRLLHSRYGLHIMEVLAREEGRPLGFEEVEGRIAMTLAQQSRATALHQYIRLLAGRARIEGVALEAADSPLVQ